MHLKKTTYMLLFVLILTSCAGLFINPTARHEFEEGLALFNLGKYEDALSHFQKATKLEPEYTSAYIYLGRSHLNLGQWLTAIPPLRTAYTLSPEDTKKEAVNFLLDALIGGALSEFKKGNFKNSITYLKEALDIDPDSTDITSELTESILAYGGQLMSEGKLTDAITQFSEALELAPNNLDAYLGLAKAFLKSGDWLDAMQIINDAMKIAPTEEDRSLFQDLMNQ